MLDAVLAGLEQGVDRDVLAGELNVSPDKISYVDGLIKKSAPRWQEIPYPDLPGLQLP
ncbi:hypothetical protein [Desulfofundulus thermocisternus]|uniref:hypothetical protein n=1 Tax=Desulfofundulus thermocisternus TaxID=42471 RepID=UPI001A1018CE|nr:hypothetical protein [Desulfofundulus thermocisternus]MBE3584997.1 hypothetical protein [Thermoanaerobacter sp.]MCS5694596.1 hypothetical protein [Desulfofundulus thermocisternus]